MSAPKPLEEERLNATAALVSAFAKDYPSQRMEAQIQALEAASSRLGGFNLGAYHRAFKINPVAGISQLSSIGALIVDAIFKTGIPPALALSALAREELDANEKRNTGAYHTDFRLAQYLAEASLAGAAEPASIIDPACGTGMLLAAVIHIACGADRRKATDWLRNRVHAADLSPASLRRARLSLASFTSDLRAIETMYKRWRSQDSLFAEPSSWKLIAKNGFDLVIGNPPWEKVKTTRHEFMRANGDDRHYGADYGMFDAEAYAKQQQASGEYAAALSGRYVYAKGEVDLYVAFLEMFLNITRAGGRTSVLVPAGLIRSQRNEMLRRFILDSTNEISITILENRARFFAIDTRFKFLALTCDKNDVQRESRKPALIIKHAKGTPDGVQETARAVVGRTSLAEVRPDLTVPEIRGSREWSLFLKMSRNGMRWDKPAMCWSPEIVREIDMTRDRKHFHPGDDLDGIPLVEGRMVQQHRFGSKAYRSGTGRSALWEPLAVGDSKVKPQFSVRLRDLNAKVQARTRLLRAGFCDITGQTNERSLMAAIIPAGVVCGNKVPTITFPDDPSEERLLLWVGIANSLPFDWLLRQVVTTTVNYFVLLGIPMPDISKDSLPGRQIIEATRALRRIDTNQLTAGNVGELRAKIDIAVATAYGATPADLEVMLSNFPLLDRGQPALPNEHQSTITKDLLRLTFAKRTRQASKALAQRVSKALSLGALPYVPAEHISDTEEGEVTTSASR